MTETEKTAVAKLTELDLDHRLRLARGWGLTEAAATDAVLEGLRQWCSRNGLTLPRRRRDRGKR